MTCTSRTRPGCVTATLAATVVGVAPKFWGTWPAPATAFTGQGAVPSHAMSTQYPFATLHAWSSPHCRSSSHGTQFGIAAFTHAPPVHESSVQTSKSSHCSTWVHGGYPFSRKYRYLPIRSAGVSPPAPVWSPPNKTDVPIVR